jgi:hypothetical protein
MRRFRTFLSDLGYDLDGDRRIALIAEGWCCDKHLTNGRLLNQRLVGSLQ